MSADHRFDFIVVRLREGTDQAAAEAHLGKELGLKPEKLKVVFDHIRQKGPAAIEKGVNQERLDLLQRVWGEAGVETTQKSGLAVLEGMPVVPSKPVFKCPACSHEQDPTPGGQNQCAKCGVFEAKFLETQKKQELYLREKEKLEKIHGFRKLKEDKEAREAAEQAEIDEVRRRIEEEMGLNKKKGPFSWLWMPGPKGNAARTGVGVTLLAVLLVAGWYGRDLVGGKGVTPEELAKVQAAQSKQSANQMQNMVGNLIKGSKKMAESSGAAEQFKQELFGKGGKDAELEEQLKAPPAGGADSKDALAEVDRAEGLAGATKTFAESGGSIEDAERALSASMQSAKQIKDAPQRTEVVSVVASSQVEVFTQDARDEAASGDFKAADKSFSKALSAATDISNKGEMVAARGAVAKVRADTGDYGGAIVLFLDAMKAAEEIAEPRARALAIADVAKQMAQSTNEIDGAADRGFEKALATAATVTPEANKVALTNEILVKRVQSACDVAAYLYRTEPTPTKAQGLLTRAGADNDQITNLLLHLGSLGTRARTMAEFEGESEAVKAMTAKIAKMAEPVAEPAKERVDAVVARASAEIMAAKGKFAAGKGDKVNAKKTFVAAIKASNSIATKSQDPLIRSEIYRHRTEALGTVARYLQAAGDKEAASKVFMLAMNSAGSTQAPKVLSMMVRASRGG